MVDTQALMKQVGKIRIMTGRLIDDQLSGDYLSTFKGQGVEFDEVRPYQPGDDVRQIDWNVTARTGEPFIKRFSEERELTIHFLVDVSGSQAFGSGERSKASLAAELTALLALTAIRNQDKIGLTLFTNRIINHIPARKGRTAVMRLVREVLAAEETYEQTDIRAAIRFLNSIQKRKAIVFLISDFQDAHYERDLTVLARRHDVIVCPVRDPAESILPNVGLVELQDPETRESFIVDTASKAVRDDYAMCAQHARTAQLKRFRACGIDILEVFTDKPYIHAVRELFRKRARKS